MFQTKSFSPISFSLHAFRGARSEGRSGVARLNLYAIQEKVLNERNHQEAIEITIPVPRVRTVIHHRTKKRINTRVGLDVPYYPKPLYQETDNSISNELSDLIHTLKIEFSSWKFTLPLISLNPLKTTPQSVDDEDDIEALLLAA